LFTAAAWGLTWPHIRADDAVAGVAEGVGDGRDHLHTAGLGLVAGVANAGERPTIWKLVVALAAFEHPDFGRVTEGEWVSATYISTIPLTVAYLAWFPALRMVPASTAATVVLMSPVVGAIGAGVLLDDTFGPRQIVALAMTLSGAALAARGWSAGVALLSG
jgi:drug/metabolite transporter (DMT)-like permease